MKKIILAFFLFSLVFPLVAHDSAIPVSALGIRTSLYPTISGGAFYQVLYGVNADYEITGITLQTLTSEYDFSLGADVEKLEFGITNYFSLGLDVSLLNLFRLQESSGNWILYAAPYLRFDLLNDFFQSNGFYLHFVSKCFISPVFSFPGKSAWMGDGLISLFNTASINYEILDTDNVQLYGYLDFKFITTWINEGYNDVPIDLSYWLDLSPEELAQLPVTNETLNKIAVCPGLELSWGFFNFYLGFNFKLFQFSTSTFESIDQCIRDISPSNLDIGWNFKF